MPDINEAILEHFYEMISESKVEMFDKIAGDRTKFLTVVLENIFQEHNASAVMRTCDCFGIQDLHAIEKNNKYTVQTEIARGASQWVDLHTYSKAENPTKDCIQALKDKGYRIVATTPHENDHTVHDLPIDKPIALVFGTEWTGISQEVIDLADDFVKIPMYGFTESFNISVCAALALQTLRKRLEDSGTPFTLSHEEQVSLKIDWSTKIVKNGGKVKEEIRNRLLDKRK
ncbi:MAG: tRNA (guanosine-2'-O-)-methyltransferase [Psychromonas sp.]|jgi:tRNA (guanosine-2'-O-)-methyltransferase